MNLLTNSVTLIGHLGKDPEALNTKGTTAATTFSMATSESYVDKKGERVTTTQWHRCIVFGKRAENILQLAHKGSKIMVQGQIKYNRYTDKDGIERLSVDIQVGDFMLIEAKAVAKAA